MTVPHSLDFQHVFEPGTEAGAPFTTLLLHGTGADEHDLLPVARAVAPGKPVLSPLGKVRENGMPRWFRRLREGVFDEEDIKHRSAELATFLEEAAKAYALDPPRYVAVGFSNGANIAASLLLLQPGTLRGAVLLRAMVPLVPETLPDLSGVPVYISAGTQDPLIPVDDVRRLVDLLKRAGADVTLRWVETGHGLTLDELRSVRTWLKEKEALLEGPVKA